MRENLCSLLTTRTLLCLDTPQRGGQSLIGQLGAAQGGRQILIGRLQRRYVEVQDNPCVEAERATQQHEDED